MWNNNIKKREISTKIKCVQCTCWKWNEFFKIVNAFPFPFLHQINKFLFVINLLLQTYETSTHTQLSLHAFMHVRTHTNALHISSATGFNFKMMDYFISGFCWFSIHLFSKVPLEWWWWCTRSYGFIFEINMLMKNRPSLYIFSSEIIIIGKCKCPEFVCYHFMFVSVCLNSIWSECDCLHKWNFKCDILLF